MDRPGWERPVPAPVDAFWASELGCDPAVLARPGATVVVHPDPDPDQDEPYALAFWRPPAMVAAVPAAWREVVAERLAGADPDVALAPAELAAVFGGAASEVIGPAFQGWLDPPGFTPAAESGVRRLGADDRAALAGLRRAAGETAWEHSAIDPGSPPLFGRFDGRLLVAAGTLVAWGEPVVHVGLLTRPGHRGRGHARAVASAMTRTALTAGIVPHYQTLDANRPSLAVAAALGYRRHATTVAVRLAAAAP